MSGQFSSKPPSAPRRQKNKNFNQSELVAKSTPEAPPRNKQNSLKKLPHHNPLGENETSVSTSLSSFQRSQHRLSSLQKSVSDNEVKCSSSPNQGSCGQVLSDRVAFQKCNQSTPLTTKYNSVKEGFQEVDKKSNYFSNPYSFSRAGSLSSGEPANVIHNRRVIRIEAKELNAIAPLVCYNNTKKFSHSNQHTTNGLFSASVSVTNAVNNEGSSVKKSPKPVYPKITQSSSFSRYSYSSYLISRTEKKNVRESAYGNIKDLPGVILPAVCYDTSDSAITKSVVTAGTFPQLESGKVLPLEEVLNGTAVSRNLNSMKSQQDNSAVVDLDRKDSVKIRSIKSSQPANFRSSQKRAEQQTTAEASEPGGAESRESVQPVASDSAETPSPSVEESSRDREKQRSQGRILPPLPPRVNRDRLKSVKESILIEACKSAEEEDVLMLLKKILTSDIDPALLNLTDSSGRTAVSYACSNGFLGVVETLSTQPNIDLNLPDTEGNTPLHYSAQAGQNELVAYLVNKCSRSVDLDMRNSLGFTPLMKAAIQGRTKIAKILLFAGASPHMRDFGRGLCALEWARYTGRYNCSELIESVERSCSTQLREKWTSDPDLKNLVTAGGGQGDNKQSWIKHKLKKAFHKSDSKKEFHIAPNIPLLARCVTSPLLPSVKPHQVVVPQVQVTEVVAPDCYVDPDNEEESDDDEELCQAIAAAVSNSTRQAALRRASGSEALNKTANDGGKSPEKSTSSGIWGTFRIRATP